MSKPSILRRHVLCALSVMLGAAGLFSSTATRAADYPNKPIKIVVAFGPGGLSDLTTRELGRLMQAKLGTAVIIDNKPGAGQVVGMQSVFTAPPDGYTLILGSATGFSLTPNLFKNLTIDPSKFVPIAPVSMASTVVVALPDYPANNLTEFAKHAKAQKNPPIYASIGVGTTPHIAMEIFKKGAKMDATHVPYRGDAPALLALLSHEVDVAVITMFSAQPRIKAGEIKGLGVFQTTPAKTTPNIQTSAQAGVPDADLPGWIGLFAPPGTPKDIVQKLEVVTREVVASQGFQDFVTSRGSEPLQVDNKQFVTLISKMSTRAGSVIRALDLKPDE
jgi:tripartite-type tricarboxylate transporter receptor subunit TctC